MESLIHIGINSNQLTQATAIYVRVSHRDRLSIGGLMILLSSNRDFGTPSEGKTDT
jgi:hypothetical protein